jgi:hypothetical protein
MTLEEWDEIIVAQNNCCAICLQPETRKRTSRLMVDHCHKTNRFRGAICHRCNAALGYVKDNLLILDRIRLYLKRFGPTAEQYTIRAAVERDPLT